MTCGRHIAAKQRQRKRTEKMLSSLKNGDVVQTSGGIVGSVVSLESDRLVLDLRSVFPEEEADLIAALRGL